MFKGYIYRFRNKITNKSYVGQTKDLISRIKSHKKSKGDTIFHKALKSYGIENFEIRILKMVYAPTEMLVKQYLNILEEQAIIEENCISPNGYNLKSGGEQCVEYCKESRERMSKSAMGRPSIKYWLGKTQSEESNRKRSETQRGMSKPSVSQKLKGRKLSEAHIEKLKHPKTEEHRNNIRNSKLGNKNPMFGKTYKWYNDGERNIRIFENQEAPDGFTRGFLHK